MGRLSTTNALYGTFKNQMHFYFCLTKQEQHGNPNNTCSQHVQISLLMRMYVHGGLAVVVHRGVAGGMN